MRQDAVQLVKLLLEKGASLEVINKNNQTPLHWAAQNHHTDIVQLLLNKGAELAVRG